MKLDPIHPEFGARVSGVDLSNPLDDETFAAIDEAVNRHSFLLFEKRQKIRLLRRRELVVGIKSSMGLSGGRCIRWRCCG